MARSASRSDTSNGNDGTPTIDTCGLAPVNRDSSRTSRLAVPARVGVNPQHRGGQRLGILGLQRVGGL